ncbi:uncharacterized protein MELLADRAFT_55052 [Melampsora larici-populina 98AG31]|uniref:Uncharacterized protein n=1 Tax=Melampsora larici-populina (strain 98AG31 / pathotype 3-4-7) TaxID=747676 RepID=F4RAG6_MELLP|nr:uncharacterized protein MELLADRAFT_55052 [Melampsora larici-populina 98AG31]EGG10477.1 hypothetical protein MELLADRAFT_55052 [Melampsora larici-populina 98AG31]
MSSFLQKEIVFYLLLTARSYQYQYLININILSTEHFINNILSTRTSYQQQHLINNNILSTQHLINKNNNINDFFF